MSARLTCEQCQKRKVKCDKGHPCSACLGAQLQCNAVRRARRPRGRSGKFHNDNNALKTKLARLEDLVDQLKTQVEERDEHDKNDNINNGPPDLRSPSSRTFSTNLPHGFWSALSNEVVGLRHILEDSDDDAEHPTSVQDSRGKVADLSYSYRALLFNHGELLPNNITLSLPPSNVRDVLLRVYRHRVDSVFKLLHWPSFMAAIQAKYPVNNGHVSSHFHNDALEFACYFMAVCSMSEAECKTMLSEERKSLLQQYRLTTELALSNANLYQNPNLSALQAFVIYLVGMQAAVNSTSAWALLAVAARIAKSSVLHYDPSTVSVYERELCRRLWFCLGVLDTQTALDRGTVPLLPAEDFTSPPLRLNDSDLSVSTTGVAEAPYYVFTDMSYSALTHQATIFQKELCTPASLSENGWATWKVKLESVSCFEDNLKHSYYHFMESENALEKLTGFTARGIALTMHLLLRRPPYRSRSSTTPPWDEFDIIQGTTEVLQGFLNKKAVPAFTPWSWFAWSKWYALAVLLAELCNGGKGSIVDSAYLVAQETYNHYADSIDTNVDVFWRPISKLMRRVQRQRSPTLRIAQATDMQSGPQNLNQFQIIEGQYAGPLHNINNECAHVNTQTESNAIFTDDLRLDLHPDSDGNDTSWVNWDMFLQDMDSSYDSIWTAGSS